jgi:hypothetical protein
MFAKKDQNAHLRHAIELFNAGKMQQAGGECRMVLADPPTIPKR